MTLTPENSTKYLGYMLNKKLNSKDHIKLRIKNTLKRYYSLNSLGLNSKAVDPITKAFIISTYCLPILYYSIENAELSPRQQQDIRSTVGELVKKSLNIRQRCHTTDLLAAVDIKDPLEVIIIRKLKLFSRLLDNPTTLAIIEEENKEFEHGKPFSKQSFTEQIYDILKINERVEFTDVLEAKGVEKIHELENKYKAKKEEFDVINLRYLLEENKIGDAEEMITPAELAEWIRGQEEDTQNRVLYLHSLFDAIEGIERINLNEQ